MRIAIVGAGYVGLVAGACFAEFGHYVVCVDRDPDKIRILAGGKVPIHEPGLVELVVSGARAGRLEFTTLLGDAVRNADAVFITVGTPAHRDDGYADLAHVLAAAREIAAELSGFTVLVVKSTVPIGTGDEVERLIREARPEADVAVVSNPEFLREGSAIRDFKQPDRIVVGTDDTRARALMGGLYRPLQTNSAPIVYTGRRTAELIKYAANAFLATKIAFINEIADLCEKAGGDVLEVARGIGLDRRIGASFLQAGPGFGGSCFPKDMLALIRTAKDYDARLCILEAVLAVNEARKIAMAEKVAGALGGEGHGRTVAILGLTFKPNTDDMREAPSVPLIAALQGMGASVRAYDPAGTEQAKLILSGVTYCGSATAAAKDADALVIVTEWEEFQALDFAELKQVMAKPVLVDLRNLYRPEEVTRHGFTYVSVGRPQPD